MPRFPPREIAGLNKGFWSPLLFLNKALSTPYFSGVALGEANPLGFQSFDGFETTEIWPNHNNRNEWTKNRAADLDYIGIVGIVQSLLLLGIIIAS